MFLIKKQYKYYIRDVFRQRSWRVTSFKYAQRYFRTEIFLQPRRVRPKRSGICQRDREKKNPRPSPQRGCETPVIGSSHRRSAGKIRYPTGKTHGGKIPGAGRYSSFKQTEKVFLNPVQPICYEILHKFIAKYTSMLLICWLDRGNTSQHPPFAKNSETAAVSCESRQSTAEFGGSATENGRLVVRLRSYKRELRTIAAIRKMYSEGVSIAAIERIAKGFSSSNLLSFSFCSLFLPID